MMPKSQQVANCDPAKGNEAGDVPVKIDIDACVESFPEHNLIPMKAGTANHQPSRKWIIGLLVVLLTAVVGLSAALTVHIISDHRYYSSSPAAVPAASSSSPPPSNDAQLDVVDLGGDDHGLERAAVVDLGGDDGPEVNANASLVTTSDIAASYILSAHSTQSSSDDIQQCSQGLIPWNTTEKSRDWYIASNRRCSTSGTRGTIILSPGESVGDQVGCFDDGPHPCPKMYDGSLEACQNISMLSVFGQSAELRFYDGDWITWNEISQECRIYDRDSQCDGLVEGDDHDHSFQFCGQGYVASKYVDGDEAHETCEHGALEYSENPWVSAKGMACTGSSDGDDLPVEVFKSGQSVQGCDSDDCISIYEGTVESCHRLAAHSMTGINQELLELHVGSWMSFDEVTGDCFLWSQCGKLSPSSTISSFQYCGVSHKSGGEQYVDYYSSDYDYEYGSEAEEDYPY